jgi:hypothetical protein
MSANAPTKSRLSGWRGALAGSIVASISLLVTLGVLELALVVLYPQGGSPLIFEFDPELGHRHKPNLDFVHVWNGHDNVSSIRTNSFGLRSPAVPLAKESGEYRILALGDSYTFGYGVGDEDAFPAVLGKMLAAAGTPSLGRTTVINAGVSSYGTAQELLYYKNHGRAFQPDLVLLNMFVGNDVQDNLCTHYTQLTSHTRFPCYAVEGGELVLKSKPQEPGSKAKKKIRLLPHLLYKVKRTNLFQMLYGKAKSVLASNAAMVGLLGLVGVDVHPGYVPHVVSGWYAEERAAEGWALTRALLEELQRAVEADGAKLALVAIPSRVQVISQLFEVSAVLYPGEPSVEAFLQDPAKPQRALQAFGQEIGIPVLDLIPAFAERDDTQQLYYPSVAHWNEKGNHIAAEHIHAFLIENRLVPSAAQ